MWEKLLKILDKRWAVLTAATMGGVIALAGPVSAQTTSAGAPAHTSVSSVTASSSVAAHRHHRHHHWYGVYGTPGTGCYYPGAYSSHGSYGSEGQYGPWGVHATHGAYESCGPNFGGGFDNGGFGGFGG
jgi:hypothetical protein